MKTINLAVRELVEFVMMSGDLVLDKFSARGNLITGQKIHQRLQAQRPENYQTEVAISDIFTRDNLQIRLNGRIDGIFQQPAGIILEEIKSITSENHRKGNLDHPRHWAQAKVYAYLYMKAKDLNIIRIRLTYYFVESGTTESQEKEFGFRELEEFTTDLIDQYSTWLLRYEDYHLHRDRSLQQSRFPYQDYRQGQEKICTAVAKAIRESRDVFLQAPTGLGKTMAVIYPAVLSLTELESGKIFYLTARSTAQENAEYALKKIIAAGAGIKFLVISAREKVCFQEECRCNPDDCEYAAGFFDKLPAALWELYKHNIFDRKRIDEISIRHRICPFEYSLEISLWVDCIICDYNYVFDPRVRLKRFFMNERQKGDFILLVDEAHNLVDRSRDMFSASLNKKDFLKIRRLVRGILPELVKSSSRINSWFLKISKSVEHEDAWNNEEAPEKIFTILRKFTDSAGKWLALNQQTSFRNELLDLFFQAIIFLSIGELYSSDYTTYYERDKKDIKVKLLCINPAVNLQTILQKCRIAVFFSATLTPVFYFQQVFGREENSRILQVASPFPAENLLVLMANRISTYYRDREITSEQVMRMIVTFLAAHQGNYLVFFSILFLYEYGDTFCDESSSHCRVPDSDIRHAGKTAQRLSGTFPL